MSTCGVILAAGAGRRFGGPKQLAELDGRPMLQHVVDTACATPELDRVIIVLGAESARVLTQLQAGRALVETCEDWEEGVAASLRCGVGAATRAEWVVVLLGDEPRLPVEAIALVVEAALDAPPDVLAVRARWGDRLGHPVALRRAVLERVEALRGDAGARELLEDVGALEVDCSDLHHPGDVDTPEQLEGLR
jgi:CTP:molybdopterin cytidylyltransferase MocA